MRTLKRMFGLTGLTAALGALVAAAPVHAQTAPGGSFACTVLGEATMNPPVAIGPNTGSYRFDSPGERAGLQLNCVVDNGVPSVHTVSLTSTGTYTNTVCGSGTASSTVTDITSVWPPIPLPALEYDIAFNGTAGLLTFRSANSGNASGGGPIQITDPTPMEINPTTGVCTSDFEVTGAVQGSFP